MTMVTISEEKGSLIDLVTRVSKDERIILATEGAPVAELVPYNAQKTTLKFGLMKGKIRISEDFDQLSDGTSEFFRDYIPE